MKIKDMKTKTSIEVTDNDLLVIEDSEETKSITVKEFKKILNKSSDEAMEKTAKKVMNEFLDKVKKSLDKLTFDIAENIIIEPYIFKIDAEGTIYTAYKHEGRYLDILSLLKLFDKQTISMKVNVNEIEQELMPYNDIEEFNKQYLDMAVKEPDLAEANAAVIKFKLNNVKQNDVSKLTSEMFKIEIARTEEKIYHLSVTKEKFKNEVPFVEEVPIP